MVRGAFKRERIVKEIKAALELKKQAIANTELRFLTIKEVCNRVGHKKSWVWQHARDGTFVAPLQCGKSARWLDTAILEWQVRQVESSSKAA
jgi:predicted DNA-binding transcriptional regulator AlpA